MKRFFRFIFALLAIFCVACTNSGEEGGLPGGDNGGNGGNGDNTTPAVTFTIEVSDKTPINAEVSVTPSDKTITYFCDAVSKADFERFATAKACARKVISDLKTVCESQGYTLADVLSTGAGSRRFIGFDPETEYYILAFGVNVDGTITTEVFTELFTTLAEVVDAEMTFEVKVSKVTSNSAYVTVTPSNKSATYYFDVVSKEELERYSDAKTYAKKVIASIKEYNDFNGVSLAWNLSAGVDGYLFKEGTTALVPNTDYCAFAFGVTTEGTITTEVTVEPFKTLEAAEKGDKAFDNLSYGFFTYYGDIYGTNAATWYIDIYPEEGMDILTLEVQTSLDADDFTGNYPLASTFEAGTSVAGFIDAEGYICGSYWCTLDNSYNISNSGFCKTGNVAISRLGDEYTVVVDAVDADGYKVTANYTGSIEEFIPSDEGLLSVNKYPARRFRFVPKKSGEKSVAPLQFAPKKSMVKRYMVR